MGRIAQNPKIYYWKNGVIYARFTIGVPVYRPRPEGGVMRGRDYFLCSYYHRVEKPSVDKIIYPNSAILVDGKLEVVIFERDGKTVYEQRIACDIVVALEKKKTVANKDLEYE